MPSEYGTHMMNAMRAVSEMHGDCIRMFHALDKELAQYRVVYNTVTFEQGQTIARRSYLAEVLLRHYSLESDSNRVLGINLCLFDPWTDALHEPMIVVANTTYKNELSTAAEASKRYWDPWEAWLKWLPSRVHNQGLKVEPPRNRLSISNMTVAAAPLASISGIEAAMALIDLAGRP